MEILINYSDIEKAWYPSKEEWINFLNKIQTKNININITKYFIEKYIEIEKETIKFIKDNEGWEYEDFGWKKIPTSLLICDKCKTNLVFWKFDGNIGIYRCPKFPSCSGCFKKDHYWKRKIKCNPYGINNPSFKFKEKISKYVFEKSNFEIKDNCFKDYLDYLNLDSLFNKYIRTKTKGIFKKVNKETKKYEKEILIELKIIFKNKKIRYQQPIFYKLKNGKFSYVKPDFIIEKEKDVLVLDEKKEYWYCDEKQIESYKSLLCFIYGKDYNFISYFIISRDSTSFFSDGYEKRKNKYGNTNIVYKDELNKLYKNSKGINEVNEL